MWNIDWLTEQEDTCLPLQQSVSQLTVVTQLVPKPYVGLSFYEKTLHVILSSSPKSSAHNNVRSSDNFLVKMFPAIVQTICPDNIKCIGTRMVLITSNALSD